MTSQAQDDQIFGRLIYTYGEITVSTQSCFTFYNMKPYMGSCPLIDLTIALPCQFSCLHIATS